MNRAYYADSIESFLAKSKEAIIGTLSMGAGFTVEQPQRDAWAVQVEILKAALSRYSGAIYFEFSIPRMGRRIDAVLLIGSVVFVVEFKVGAKDFASHAIDQVCDYALDLKNFHEPSHKCFVTPVLVATNAQASAICVSTTPQNDNLINPIKATPAQLDEVIDAVLLFAEGTDLDREKWETGRYSPTPTIVEAAMALYGGHAVEEISRRDAGAINLKQTTDCISEIIRNSQAKGLRSICFVTGVPGAGKTLVGLDIATKHVDKNSQLYSVFLSGNGPLVSILREALARDKVRRVKERGNKIRKGEALSEVQMFIQNVHHFRDECLRGLDPPIEHVALFDEAQRAWDLKQTANFMQRKRGQSNFNQSEPEFLISCLDRHMDWAVIVCLVGGGQEINTGEAGIAGWIDALNAKFPEWQVHISSRLNDSEYGAGTVLDQLKESGAPVRIADDLHLSVSMRSYRAEHVSLLVKHVLDLNVEKARSTLEALENKYPIVITRDLARAKAWLRRQARGSERYGMVVSSQAERLKPHAINVKSPINPIHWFLHGKDDVRSSYYLEDVATEFHVQGLELDWACVTWDADFRHTPSGWENWTFHGSQWKRIRQEARKIYQKNAYRVLLTRARQGMVIVVPQGDSEDSTRKHEYYDPTFEYLKGIGLSIL